MVGMIRQARMTVGRKIYALICLSCVGLLGITFLGSRANWAHVPEGKRFRAYPREAILDWHTRRGLYKP